MPRKQSKHARNTIIDIGLSALCQQAHPGQTLSVREIATVCECSHQSINNLIKSGLTKLRKRVKLAEHLEG